MLWVYAFVLTKSIQFRHKTTSTTIISYLSNSLSKRGSQKEKQERICIHNMKLYSIPVTLLLLSAVSGKGGKEEASRKKAALVGGYNWAFRLWYDEDHSCATMDDLRDSAFDQCKSMFSDWRHLRIECRAGAKKFVDERLQKCVDFSACVSLGDAAAALVESSKCGQMTEPPADRPTEPPNGPAKGVYTNKCQDVARMQCRAKAMTMINDRIENYGSCRKLDDVMQIDLRELNDDCRDTVRQLAGKTK